MQTRPLVAKDGEALVKRVAQILLLRESFPTAVFPGASGPAGRLSREIGNRIRCTQSR
jgi:hypothetical protein